MAKRHITKLIVLLLSVILIPLQINLAKVSASTAYYGVEFSFEVTDSDVLAEGNDVIISANGVELYKKGKISSISDETAKSTYFFTSYKNGVVTARISKKGSYEFSVKTIVEEGETAKEFKTTVIVEDDVTALVNAKYEFDDDKLNAYKQKAIDASYVDATKEDKVSLHLDDEYIVPSVEDLINLGSFSYSQYKRTVYYSIPTSSAYSTSSASGSANLSFTVSKIGTYRFYVLLSMDKIDGTSFGMINKGLKEYADGLYTVENKSGQRLYVSGANYYLKEDFTDEYVPENEDDIVKVERIVPIFEFEIKNAGPKISIESSDPENGYVGLEYVIDDVTVSGNEVDVNYKLMYKETAGGNWAEASEEFDETTLKFTPEKLGYYKVVITAVDGDGNDVSVSTKDIRVEKKYEKVEYKTSFGDWLKVNYVPFIFLCLSGLCLIAIILLLTIKPKQKVESETVGEDK